MLYVFKRKKDQPEGEKDNHQSVRTIKTYCVDSVEYWTNDTMRLNNFVRCLKLVHTFTFRNKTIRMFHWRWWCPWRKELKTDNTFGKDCLIQLLDKLRLTKKDGLLMLITKMITSVWLLWELLIDAVQKEIRFIKPSQPKTDTILLLIDLISWNLWKYFLMLMFKRKTQLCYFYLKV